MLPFQSQFYGIVFEIVMMLMFKRNEKAYKDNEHSRLKEQTNNNCKNTVSFFKNFDMDNNSRIRYSPHGLIQPQIDKTGTDSIRVDNENKQKVFAKIVVD